MSPDKASQGPRITCMC